jgi:hypothetical protein
MHFEGDVNGSSTSRCYRQLLFPSSFEVPVDVRELGMSLKLDSCKRTPRHDEDSMRPMPLRNECDVVRDKCQSKPCHDEGWPDGPRDAYACDWPKNHPFRTILQLESFNHSNGLD